MRRSISPAADSSFSFGLMPTRFSPAGACIYCGAAMYHPTSSRPLADEHIIPFGRNGDLILPESTCQACERMTGQFEAVVLRGSLLGCRSLLGLPDAPKIALKPYLFLIRHSHRKRNI